MPLYMDVHELPDGTDEDAVAGAHAADLRVQDKYRTRYLNYWVDAGHRRAFCLVEAPDAASATAVHREAHGLVADEIYEVAAGHLTTGQTKG
jgi:Protein of unknown function (DUF4242)